MRDRMAEHGVAYHRASRAEDDDDMTYASSVQLHDRQRVKGRSDHCHTFAVKAHKIFEMPQKKALSILEMHISKM